MTYPSYIFAFDFETYRIAPGLQFPPAVCMSYAILRDGVYTSGVVQWQEGIAMLRHAGSEGAYFVGANTAFDAFVAAYNEPDVLSAVQWWARMVGAARVTDVLLRQRLLCGAVDAYKRLQRYNLASVAKHWCGVDLAKGDDTWRLRYGELDGVPVEDYPPEAYDYALGDAEWTFRIFMAQEYARHGHYDPASPHAGPRINYRERFPNNDPLLDEHRQQMKALAIKDLASVGLHTDPDRVARFKAYLEDEVAKLRPILLQHNLLRAEYSLNTDEIVRRFQALGIEVSRRKDGKPSLVKAMYQQVGDRDPWLSATQRTKGLWPDNAPTLVDAGLAAVEYVRCVGNAELAIALLYLYLEDVEPNLTPAGYPKTDSDNCDRTKHPALIAYSKYASLTKLLANDITLLEASAHEPFHAHYTTLQANGRTATGSAGGEGSVGNVQNPPRKPGVRECYKPPPGYLFADADFTAAELSTFGQVSTWWVGWSETARMIREGIDLHSVAGARLGNIPEPKTEGWRVVKDGAKSGDKHMKELRTGGKGIMFGCKARMSPKRYKGYAYTNYGLLLTDDEAARAVNLHDEIVTEMAPYSAYCERHFAREPGQFRTRYDLVHPWSGRLRADLSYTDVHNYPFSGLAQDMAAVALWDLFCASWGLSELGVNDPFFGCRPCLFTHDAITAYVPEDPARATAATRRLGEIMTLAARKVLPDVGSKAEGVLLRHLSKKAPDEPVFDLAGRMVPWDCWSAAREAADKRKPGETVREYLTREEWPPYVVDDVCAQVGE